MEDQNPAPYMPPIASYHPNTHAYLFPPETFQPRLHQLQTLSMESLGGYSEYDDPVRDVMPPPIQQRQRRREPGSDHVKHRRTRSGCYTCRQRRVKCDETHPICERCRKGKRDCQYPGTPTSASASKVPQSELLAKDSLAESDSSPSGDEQNDDDDWEALPSDPNADEGDMAKTIDQKIGTDGDRDPSAAAIVSSGKASSTPHAASSSSQRAPTKAQSSRAASKHSAKASISQSSRWPRLPKEVKAYLKYHRDSLSHHHYAFKYDAGNFLKTTFLEIAMNDDSQALLYAIVAFAAYHYTLTRDDSRISTFLSYYNKSIILLQQSLTRKRHSVATLLAILQLATIEEFLGDWVNLLGHRKAAYQILTDLFTPQTIMQDQTRRRIISWYIRFDLFAGMMSGVETVLGREWFAACVEHYSRQVRERPDDMSARYDDYFATSRLLATDISLLFGAKKKNMISDEQFAIDASNLLRQSEEYRLSVETAFTDPSNYVKEFPNAPPPSPEDITDYRDPNFFFGGESFSTNFVLLDFWSIDLMFKYQLTMAQQQQPSAELTEIALKMCKMFEAMQYYDKNPPGALLCCQGSHGIASLFLPKDDKHTNWCRRQYALIERLGWIYPAMMRKRMTELWDVDVTHWWLPNNEGYPDILRAMRDFVQYRADKIPTDALGVAVRDMNGIFQDMNLTDEHQSLPDDLKGSTTDSDPVDGAPEAGMSWESSPEQRLV